MKTLTTVLAIVGGVWLVGRVSRLSPNHPVNSIGLQLSVNLANQARTPIAPPVPETVDVMNYPYLGPAQETAQIQTALVIGEGGGE